MTEIDNLRRGLSEIATEVEAVDLRERALATSHRIRVRRTVTTAVAGLAVAAVALSTAFAVQADRSPRPPAVDPAPSPTVLPTEPQGAAPDLGPFMSGTVTVPSWGTAGDATCTTGRVTMTNGQHVRDSADATAKHRTVNVMAQVTVDVDHDGTEDHVASLMCGEGPESGGRQIVAFHRDGEELTPIARVIGTQDGIALMDYFEARDGGRIAVLVSEQYTDTGQNTVPNQWRTYALQDGRFQQVEGPTSFPAQPPAARLTVESSTLSFQRQGGGLTGRLTVTVRNTGAVDVARLELLLILPSQVRPAGEDWRGCAVRPSPDQTALVCAITGPPAQSRVSVTFTFVATGKPVLLDDPITLGNHYLYVAQAPPFDGLVTISTPEVIIPITTP